MQERRQAQTCLIYSLNKNLQDWTGLDKMTHGDPVGRSNSRTGHGGGPGGANGGSNGRQTPIMDSDCEDSSANTPMSAKMGKLMSVKVLMLDDSITVFQVQVSPIF